MWDDGNAFEKFANCQMESNRDMYVQTEQEVRKNKVENHNRTAPPQTNSC